MIKNKKVTQSVNHLGFLKTLLENLKGYAALSNEITQNADDAEATWLNFDITDEALIIENSSTFIECQNADEPNCLLKDSEGKLCDFHSFSNIASGNKRLDNNKTGAFGIGFNSVYQITDRPEFISGERHWIINPAALEHERIDQISHQRIDFTRFILPWAIDPQSFIRKELSLPAVTIAEIEKLNAEIINNLSETIMFLKHIEEINVKRNGKLIKKIKIERKTDSFFITNDSVPTEWLIFKGDFDDKVHQVDLPDNEKGRKTEVTIALPLDNEVEEGILFAYLPTEQRTGLPFYINANFFPQLNRKHILFEKDYHSKWNRLCIETAAEVLAEQLPQLPQKLGAFKFWQTLSKLEKVSIAANERTYDISFQEFWKKAKYELPKLECVLSSQNLWKLPKHTRILHDYKKESSVILILEELGLNIVNQDLKEFEKLLVSQNVGVQRFDLGDLADLLKQNNLKELTPFEQAPEWLKDEENHKTLANEIKFLNGLSNNENHLDKIRASAVAKTHGGNFDTPESIFNSDNSIHKLFFPLGLEPYFADKNPSPIEELIKEFRIQDALDLLKTVSDSNNEIFTELLIKESDSFIKLVRWLVDRCLRESDETKAILKNLPLWLSNGKLHPLGKLVVPGSFVDELKLGKIIDTESLQIKADRLFDIGADELTIRKYVSEMIPDFLKDNNDPESYKKVIKFFVKNLEEIKQFSELKNIIGNLQIIECQDGEYKAATNLYFRNEFTEKLINKERLINPSRSYSFEMKKFFEYLGIPEKPKIDDVIAQINNQTQHTPSLDSIEIIKIAIEFLGEEFNHNEDLNLEQLKNKRWLPAEDDISQWYFPQFLYPHFQKHLFETTGKFINLEPPKANKISNFLKYLKVNKPPSTELVVNHLKNCIQNNKPVKGKGSIYQFLDDNANDYLVATLKNSRCIYLPILEKYVSPEEVFWSDHPFGKFRHRLDPDWGKYKKFFEVIEVKDKPDHLDALKVLKEIENNSEQEDFQIKDETINVVNQCWLLLMDAPGEELKKLEKARVIPTKSGKLALPTALFFDDLPALSKNLELNEWLLEIPKDIYKPMNKAGLRYLSEVLQMELVDVTNNELDVQLNQKTSWAIPCIERVIESSRKNKEFEYSIEHLKSLKIIKVENLCVEYSIPEIEFFQENTKADAYFESETSTIYYQSKNQLALFREIIISISKYMDLNTALTLKEIFSAENYEEASQKLDSIGIPNFENKTYEVPVTNLITTFENEEQKTDKWENSDESDEYGDGSAKKEQPNPQLNQQDKKFDNVINSHQENERKNNQNLNQSPYQNKSSNSGISPHSSKDVSNKQSVQNTRSQNAPYSPKIKSEDSDRSRLKKRPRNRWLSYVGDNHSQTDPNLVGKQRVEHNQRIDEAGIRKVLEFERSQGRYPEEMHKFFQGYDIKSLKSKITKEIARKIEVKSLGGAWDWYGAGISNRQFDECLKEKDIFWLYIVEFADQPNAKIYRIKNPVAKITNYYFDENWKLLAEK